MPRYSHSKLSTFSECRYKYKLKYIDRICIDTKDKVETFLGRIVHDTLMKLYKGVTFEKIDSLEEVLKYCNDNWKKEWTNDILIVNSEYTEDNYRKLGERYITDYYNQYAPFNQLKILGLETQDTIKLSDKHTYDIRIDKFGALGNTYYICDYKTDRNLKTQERADSDRQLAMYSIWARENFKDAKRIILLWHMLAFNKEVTSERSEEELIKLKEDVTSLIEAIESCKEYPTNVTRLCDWCEYKGICPCFIHEEELKIKTPREFKDDSGVKLIDEFSELKIKKDAIEKRMEEIKSDIQLFANEKGLSRVLGSSKYAKIEYYPRIDYSANKDKLIELIKNKDLVKLLLQVNYSGLLSRFKKNDLDQEIIKLLEITDNFRVSIYDKAGKFTDDAG